MTPLEIAFADRAQVTDRLELLAESLSDSGLQRVTRDRYNEEVRLLAERLERLDDMHYCASCENVEVECEGDLCAGCHDSAGERQYARRAEGL